MITVMDILLLIIACGVCFVVGFVGGYMEGHRRWKP